MGTVKIRKNSHYNSYSLLVLNFVSLCIYEAILAGFAILH